MCVCVCVCVCVLCRLNRVCVRECGVTGATIRPGTRVEIPLDLIHHLHSHWDSPHSFSPDRSASTELQLQSHLQRLLCQSSHTVCTTVCHFTHTRPIMLNILGIALWNNYAHACPIMANILLVITQCNTLTLAPQCSAF